jgi:glycosidase
MKAASLFLTVSGALALAMPFACGSSDLQSHSYSPPTGVGGFDPGMVGPAVGTGTGTGSGNPAGTGGAGGSGPPVCDDSLKRCDHVFTYAGMGNETTVEVHGSFDGWGPGVPMVKDASGWSATAQVPYNADILYKFVINGSSWIPDPANANQVSDGFGGFNSKLDAFTCDPYSCAPAPPMGDLDWSQQVLYFVFVDRFLDGNPANNGAQVSGVQPAANYQGGDYAGVTKKITDGYFTDLGITALWLTVPMDNPEVSGLGTDGKLYSAYHGYWPQNLDKTEERFGTIAELKGLVDAAHAKGLKVILDYAMNHVHQSSPVYAQHPDWFWPSDLNGQSCICGSAACGWDSGNAKQCWFADYLPDFNFTVDAARKFSVDNAITWVKNTGADGFRLDAVKHIETSWITDLRARVTSDIEPGSMKHFYMVGETFTGQQDLIKSFIDPVTKLDGQFDFPLRLNLLQSMLIKSNKVSDLEAFMNQNDGYYGDAIMSTFIGNHDVPRAIHFAQDQPLWSDPWADGKDKNWSNQPGLPGGTSAFERLANVYTILFTSKGIPLIYYGDEVGMPGAGDPDNRRMMQWSGYSAGQTALLAKVKKLTAIRKGHKALWYGTRTTLSVGDETWAYKMASGTDTVYVAVNRSDSAQSIDKLPGGALTDLLGGGSVTGPTIMVPARSSMILTSP